MERHTIKVELLTRDNTSVQTHIIPPFEMEIQSEKPRELTEKITAALNLVEVIGAVSANYMVIKAEYRGAYPSAGAVAGDPAPFAVRINGDTTDRSQKGILVWSGAVTSLFVSTPSTVEVVLKICLG